MAEAAPSVGKRGLPGGATEATREADDCAVRERRWNGGRRGVRAMVPPGHAYGPSGGGGDQDQTVNRPCLRVIRDQPERRVGALTFGRPGARTTRGTESTGGWPPAARRRPSPFPPPGCHLPATSGCVRAAAPAWHRSRRPSSLLRRRLSRIGPFAPRAAPPSRKGPRRAVAPGAGAAHRREKGRRWAPCKGCPAAAGWSWRRIRRGRRDDW